ncbi:MAG: two-component sensor histidine kinase [Acidiphilium sp. 21-60-14]|nr:MAG: two-component sensor histidine kinase [Acidiphilium sp. 21-60-14]OYV90162.1 MAG: two-component sensor histidine kinase [Acidiphilium sp. 37-60-79]OZB41445.1 MAG: two-component sensor histidine kinase [Acidiphilium sp. 34-60-192]
MDRPRGRRVRSLSARLLRLTVVVTLLVEVMILLPSLGLERDAWLLNRVTDAHLAAITVAASPHGVVDLSTRDELLRLSGTMAISLVTSGKTLMVMPPSRLRAPNATVDLTHESLLASMVRALRAVIGLAPHSTLVIAQSPLRPDVTVKIIVRNAALTRHLRHYAEHIAALSLAIALTTGLVVYLALDRILVLPIRRLTASIAAFRADPERAAPIDVADGAGFRDDEIALAAGELAQMQTELRAALWRNARLAALGTAVAKISHDLRNILASALLVADRLAGSDDPLTQRAATTLVGAVDRATALVTQTLNFAREGPPLVLRAETALAALVDDVAEQVRLLTPGVDIICAVPGDLRTQLDRDQFHRVLLNLLRNAVEAGGRRLEVRAALESAGALIVEIEDNGPGLPERARANLFRPFVGSARRDGTGLGLAIVRDLIRAHGGEIELVRTGREGSLFRITIPDEATQT